jgi:arginine N-succinyltransferase
VPAHTPNGSLVWLVANRRFEEFRVILAEAPSHLRRFPLNPEAAARLGVADGDTVRAVPLSPKDRR